MYIYIYILVWQILSNETYSPLLALRKKKVDIGGKNEEIKWRMTRMQQRVKARSPSVFENHSQRHISQLMPKRTWKCYYICWVSPSFPSRWTTFIKAQLLTWYAVRERAHIFYFILFFSTSWHDVTMHEIHETLDTACTCYCLAEDQRLSIFPPISE